MTTYRLNWEYATVSDSVPEASRLGEVVRVHHEIAARVKSRAGDNRCRPPGFGSWETGLGAVGLRRNGPVHWLNIPLGEAVTASVSLDQVVCEILLEVTDAVEDPRVLSPCADVCGSDALAAPLRKGVRRPVEEPRCRHGVDGDGVLIACLFVV